MALELTSIQKSRWDAHQKFTRMCKKNTSQYKADELKIIEMSVDGKSLKEIKAAVPGNWEKMISARSKGRRQGLL